MNPRFTTAIIAQLVWKSDEARRMAVAICKVALACQGEFSANDLPEFEHGGTGIAGTVFHVLKAHGIIAKAQFLVGSQWIDKTVLNDGGNKISVYRLANAGLARALIGSAGDTRELRQGELV